MSVTIHLRHIADSSLAGQSLILAKPEVRLGRRPENDVIFDPDRDRTVSGYHCRLFIQNHSLCIEDAGSRNGTFVNDRRITGVVPIAPSDRIMLGERGPVLQASLSPLEAPADTHTDAHNSPATIVGQWTSPGTSPRPSTGLLDRADLPKTSPPPPRVPVVEDTAAVPAISTPNPAFAIAPPVEPTVPRPASRASQTMTADKPAKTTIGMNTLVMELDKAARRERKRVLALAIPVVIILVGGTSLVAWLALGRADNGRPTVATSDPGSIQAAPRAVPTSSTSTNAALPPEPPGTQTTPASTTQPATLPANPLSVGPAIAPPTTRESPATVVANPPPAAIPPATNVAVQTNVPALDWADVLEKRKRSVYVVIRQTPGKEDRGVGTAWSVAPGLLATNAHVAETFQELEPGETLIARSNNLPVSEVKIAGAKLHPGYLRFERMWKAHLPIDPDTGRTLTYPTPFDVALMTLTTDSQPRQEPPLTLADSAALTKVAEATELAYVGFPMESAAERGVNLRSPVAHVFLGHLTRKTDIFLAGGNPDRANFLQYTMTVQGGASGSPVFDRGGRVVGLISGNDHAASGTGGRIAISGKAFGPRSDAVRELIDGTAERNLAPYLPDWRAHFRERFEKAARAGKYIALAENRATTAFDLQVIASKIRNQRFNYRTARPLLARTAQLTAGAGDTQVDFGTVADAGMYCVVVTTDDPDLVPSIAVPGKDDGVRTSSSWATLSEKLGQGSPCAGSIAFPLTAGETLRVKVNGSTAETTASARVRVQLFRAVE